MSEPTVAIRQPCIQFFMTGDFPEGAANASRMKEYLLGLQKRGCRVELYILWPSGFSSGGINPKTNGEWQGIYFNYLSGRNTRPVGYAGRITDTLRAWVKGVAWIVKKRKNTAMAFLYCPDIYYFWPLFLALRLCGIPVITERTELKSGLYIQPGKRKNLFYYLNLFDERFCHLWSGHGVVISEQLRQHYASRFAPGKLSLIPAMANLERFRPMPELQKKFTVGYIGSFGIKDGLPGMLIAFAQARKILPHLTLKLMGYCENEAAVAKLIQQHELATCVQMSGTLTYEEVPNQLAACDLLLMNRIDTRYANCGFPTKLAEYLAMGIPVIATRVGDVEHYLTHHINAMVVSPGNDRELAQSIVDRYASYEAYTAMGLAGRKAAETHFDRETGCNMLASIMQQNMRK